ncbi:MAG: triose-phosphate isomerase [Gemmatimonadales bacterium]|nr:MAG: triose-phosphate isomerase [Gemmatimonadales bacterium]
MTAVIVAGNWKMNLGPRDAELFLDAFAAVFGGSGEPADGQARPGGCRVALFPPAVSLDAARRRKAQLEESGAWGRAPALELGVQQIHAEADGAFTGETSAEQASQAGATLALVGHSERRTIFHETDDMVVRRVQAAFRAGLAPMLCVGEQLEERKAGRLEAVLLRQLEAVLSPPELRAGIRPETFSVAYEPVWAIGTGETATPDDAAEAHAILRGCLVDRLGEEIGAAIPILYGGSVKPANADELLAAPEVGGLLVGGASLDPGDFAALVGAGGRAGS